MKTPTKDIDSLDLTDYEQKVKPIIIEMTKAIQKALPGVGLRYTRE